MMSKGNRLHPVTVILNMLKMVKDGILGVLGVVALSFRDGDFLLLVIVTGVMLIIVLLISWLRWLRYTYMVKDDELQVAHGIIIRKKRHISRQRIQSIDLTQSVIHRLLGLVMVEIETAGSGSDTEASLKAVSYNEGVRIRNQLKYAVNAAEASEEKLGELDRSVKEEAKNKRVSRQIAVKRLFIAGSTSGSLGVLAALAGVGFSQVEQVIPEHVYEAAWSWILAQSLNFLAALIVLVAIPLWLLAIAGTMIKYGRFTITRQGDELLITRGLLEKKQITIPLRRIQAVGFEQSLLRQPFGYGTPYVEIAGGSIEASSGFSTVLFPILKKSEMNAFIRSLLPETDTLSRTLMQPPPRARKFYLFRSDFLVLLVVAITVVPIVLYLPSLVWAWIGGVLLLLTSILGWQRHQSAGIRQEGDWIHIRLRRFALNQVVIHHHRVQAIEKKQHVVQKHQNLATVKVSIIGMSGVGTHYTVRDIDARHADQIADWFSHSKNKNASTL